MQDRTINNALAALYRKGGDQAKLAGALLDMRGAPIPQRIFDRPLSRGKCRRIVLQCLPCTTSAAADAVQAVLPDVSRKSATQRAYMALCRLEAQGVVKGEKDRMRRYVWRLV